MATTVAAEETTAKATAISPNRHNIQFRSFCPHSRLTRPSHRVTILHPGYTSKNRLLELLALDMMGENGQSGAGIHHGTALLICGIIAGNVWDGWFTVGRTGARVDMSREGVLTGQEYYFHVPQPEIGIGNSEGNNAVASVSIGAGTGAAVARQGQERPPYQYPIVPSFQHWQFPHDNMPPDWPRTNQDEQQESSYILDMAVPSVSSTSQAVRDRDGTCRLSGYGDQMERAHLCPRIEVDWFMQQDMDMYNKSRTLTGDNAVDDMANAMALRSDIHQSFDARRFVFVRKSDTWVAHFLADTRTLGHVYHNTQLDLPVAIHPAFVLARLAWAVFPLISNFLLRGDMRLVTIKQQQQQQLQKQQPQSDYKTQFMNKPDLHSLISPPSRNRSQSPKKRDRPTDESDDVDVSDTDLRMRKRFRLRVAPPDTHMDTSCDPPPSFASTSVSRLPSYQSHFQYVSSPSTPTSPSPCLSQPSVHSENVERRRIAALCNAALQKQRPPASRSDLICCDYNAAERDTAAGLTGPREFGGAYLCMKCLGDENEYNV